MSTKITPSPGVWLIGSEGPSDGIHDDLYARALVLDDGNASCAILGLDVVGFTLDFSDELIRLIRERTGISTVLINASHTHNAPFSMPWSVEGWERFCCDDADWRDQLRKWLPDLVESAMKACRPVKLSVGRAPVQVGMNRRVHGDDGVVMQPNANGDLLPWVDVLKVMDKDGHPIALAYSHAAHPVIIHGASSLISADYTSTAARRIEATFGMDTIPLFLQGCGADINGHPLRGGITLAEEAGRKLGDAVLEAAESSVEFMSHTLRIESTSIVLRCQDLPDMESCDAAIAAFKEHWKPQGEDSMPWNDRDKLRRLGHLRRMIKSGEQPEARLDITMLCIGDNWCLTAMPHEIFSAYALWIEEFSPFAQNMTLGYTNGCEIYVPTDADLKLGVRGGYEAACFPVPGAAALAYHKRLALKPGIEKRIKDAIKELWQLIITEDLDT